MPKIIIPLLVSTDALLRDPARLTPLLREKLGLAVADGSFESLRDRDLFVSFAPDASRDGQATRYKPQGWSMRPICGWWTRARYIGRTAGISLASPRG